jgi:hypothetical protein
MNMPTGSAEVYRSFEEFQRKFYPVWYKCQESLGTQESFGRDLARYSLEKHFPPRQGSETTEPKTGA